MTTTKHMRPKNYDNSWIGNMGLSQAKLYDKHNKIIGICLDTPNCVACAFKVNNKVVKALGILGYYDLKDIKNRMTWIEQFKSIHLKNISFNN